MLDPASIGNEGEKKTRKRNSCCCSLDTRDRAPRIRHVLDGTALRWTRTTVRFSSGSRVIQVCVPPPPRNHFTHCFFPFLLFLRRIPRMTREYWMPDTTPWISGEDATGGSRPRATLAQGRLFHVQVSARTPVYLPCIGRRPARRTYLHTVLQIATACDSFILFGFYLSSNLPLFRFDVKRLLRVRYFEPQQKRSFTPYTVPGSNRFYRTANRISNFVVLEPLYKCMYFYIH